MKSAQGVLQLQELRTMWLVLRLFWIGTDVSVRLIAEELGLPKMDIHRIITEDLHEKNLG